MSAHNTENVNHPSHYKQEGETECIEAMRLMLGDDVVVGFCKGSAFKYRWRAGKKEGNPYEQDVAKTEWYLQYLRDMIAEYENRAVKAKIGFASMSPEEEIAA